ncbi:MAG TPA: VOC family protein [Bryobacteraceae bacterium]|jgi:predicted enzyme related to lactoylglutathione lyase|nr:VOC family protein [Bryobacteraceae bacterium]
MGSPVVHFEIGCRDRGRTERFFADLFGWRVESVGPASLIETGAGGIPGRITSAGRQPDHYTIFYVEVDNIQATIDKAVSLGGKMLVPPVKTPTGFFAWIADLEGNTIGLLKRQEE